MKRVSTKDGQGNEVWHDVAESTEETLEAFIDLYCGRIVPNSALAEPIKLQATNILLADHRRRLERDGKHAITGETPEEYAEKVTKSGGRHPITGESYEQVSARLTPAGNGTETEGEVARRTRR
jgi:hypothetical protein